MSGLGYGPVCFLHVPVEDAIRTWVRFPPPPPFRRFTTSHDSSGDPDVADFTVVLGLLRLTSSVDISEEVGVCTGVSPNYFDSSGLRYPQLVAALMDGAHAPL